MDNISIALNTISIALSGIQILIVFVQLNILIFMIFVTKSLSRQYDTLSDIKVIVDSKLSTIDYKLSKEKNNG